jgi:dihydrofolate reductase
VTGTDGTARPRLSVYIATSLDGYIATVDGSLDWLDEASSADEDYGWHAFMADIDALAMGRGTYDFISYLDPLPFDGRPVFVFTHRPPTSRADATFWSRAPREAVDEWAAAGLQHVYVDGGRLISGFLAADLIDDLTITTVPVLLGDGLPLFHPVVGTRRLRRTGIETWPSGVVQVRYES